VLSWTQNGTPAKLTQTTQYPRANTTQMELQLAKPETFTTYVRIPGWTTPKTVVSVNGSKISQDVVPGRFLAIQRTWKDGDRIEVEFDMPMALEPIDTKTPGTVALLTGPTVLFAVNNPPDSITRKQLLAAAPLSQTSSDWIVKTDTRPVTMRPFSAIMNEEYRLYLQVNG
jgi:DUF1680 family protein